MLSMAAFFYLFGTFDLLLYLRVRLLLKIN